MFGSIALKTTLKPYENKSLSIVWSWYFPKFDYLSDELGNYYANNYKDSLDVAKKTLEDSQGLEKIVQNLKNFHEAFFTSTLPDYLSDLFVNSVSHFRSAMYYKDGTWRQWEAYDCVNVDSVHNDCERHIPYIAF